MSTAAIILSILTIISALGVIGGANPLNSALCLVLTLFFVAAHFAMMGAHFVAAIQVLVYAGAIMVLVIFVIMLLGVERDQSSTDFRKPQNLFAAGLIGLFVGLLIVAMQSGVASSAADGAGDAALMVAGSGGHGVGAVLFSRYVLPFEITGVLLLAAIVGAVLIAHEARRPLAEGRGLKAVRNRK